MPHLLSRLPGIAIGLAVLLAGCAGFSPDGGMSAVQDIAGSELGKDVLALRTSEDARAARDAVRHLLKTPLSADAAVQIALFNNRDLQAVYSALGISEAALVKASLPPNSTFSVSDIAGGGAFEFERTVVVSILALATLPFRAEIAGDRLRQAQLKAALETLPVAAQTRRAYYRAVAARALARFLDDAAASAETAAQLSRRLGESGAVNKLDQARRRRFSASISRSPSASRQR
jgi:outer membrane protein TolC